MTRRPGMTMTEVLVTIFIVAIGLSGVMSMFPFAARQMSDALVTDRSTSLALSTDGLVRGYWSEKVVENNGNAEPFWTALDSPGAHPSGTPTTAPAPGEASYPVFLDPMGVVGRSGNGSLWVGDTPTFVPRRNMRLVTGTGAPTNAALRLFSQPDGFSWDEESRPKSADLDPVNSTADMRELRYNSLAVIQRPNNRDRFNATLKVAVFLKRSPQYFPAGSEAVFGTTFTPGSTQIQLTSTADIRKGSWIMDATVAQVEILPATNPRRFSWVRHANFYRVVSATENTPGTFDVELHTAVTRVDGRTESYGGTAVVLAGVADVFDRPLLTGTANP